MFSPIDKQLSPASVLVINIHRKNLHYNLALDLATTISHNPSSQWTAASKYLWMFILVGVKPYFSLFVWACIFRTVNEAVKI